MRDDILNVLNNSDKALNIYEIQDLLGLSTVEDVKLLSE